MIRAGARRSARPGYTRAMEFSWAMSAEAHMISYERAAASKDAPA